MNEIFLLRQFARTPSLNLNLSFNIFLFITRAVWAAKQFIYLDILALRHTVFMAEWRGQIFFHALDSRTDRGTPNLGMGNRDVALNVAREAFVCIFFGIALNAMGETQSRPQFPGSTDLALASPSPIGSPPILAGEGLSMASWSVRLALYVLAFSHFHI